MNNETKVTKEEFEDAFTMLTELTKWFGFSREDAVLEPTDIFLDIETGKYVPLPHVLRNTHKEYVVYHLSEYFEHAVDTDGQALMERNIRKVLDDWRGDFDENDYEDDEELLDVIFDSDIRLFLELVMAQYAYENNFHYCYVPIFKITKEGM